jgi:hypothetical protein
MQTEKLVDGAVDFRLATLKAKELGIINISYLGDEKEAFQYYGEEDFKKIIEDKKYTVERFDKRQYKYTCIISGLTFFCITDSLLFENDENKIEGEA